MNLFTLALRNLRKRPVRTGLTVVGIATSVTGSADGWVVPAEIPRLRPAKVPASAQMLYRFRSAG